ncbi:MAG: GNAT family N-acetyltransferase [Proteobacteria bacterium]|nr:GNAT family N-acetyltransferase [Pseudomonadota bacterium]MDA1059775.1 GNAT family N-acetyltransferase [Pseudomonadota bacterium]
MTLHDFQIRPATLPDAATLAACIDAAYAKYTKRISDMPTFSDGIADDITNNQVWMAVQDNEIVAGLILVPQDRFMKLANLAVHPSHSGKGIGRKLIELSEREAKRQGFDELRLNTHADMPENIQLYRHLGWVEVSRQDSTVSMTKHLRDD